MTSQNIKDYLKKAKQVEKEFGKCSASYLMRKHKLNIDFAYEIMEILEKKSK